MKMIFSYPLLPSTFCRSTTQIFLYPPQLIAAAVNGVVATATVICSIIDCVEAHKESIVIDQVEAPSTGSTNIVDDPVYSVYSATNQRIQ